MFNKIYTIFPRYEFWPFWILYAPFVPYYLWNSLRLRSFTYFTLANPTWKNGGFTRYSKSEIQRQLPKDFMPDFQMLKTKEDPQKFTFPFIAKPDIGERGKQVELIQNQTDWKKYLEIAYFPLILQEYVDFPFEFGVFYARMPNEENGKILHITAKHFLQITGDGKATFGQLLSQKFRAQKRLKHWKSYYHKIWDTVLKKEEEFLIEPIGNHNRGTEFYDGTQYKTVEMEAVFDSISQELSGFYYGRYDVKAQSLEDFQKGQFVILELNGTNSEPTHIYDSSFNLQKAYQEIFNMLQIQFQIAQQNYKKGAKPTPFIHFIQDVVQHTCFPKN